MKDQEKINEQILIAEKELAALDAKRTTLQDRIRHLKGLKQSIADEQLPFNQRSESNSADQGDAHKIISFYIKTESEE